MLAYAEGLTRGMPSCPKCGTYSPASVERCPRCSTQLLFPIDALVSSFNGEFPNRLLKYGMKNVYLHEGLIYNGWIEPPRLKRGETTWLKLLFQSCYLGPVSVTVRASEHSAIKNRPINTVGTQLAPLEVAELAVPIETSFETKKGKKQVDFNIRCKPFDGVKKITELKGDRTSPEFAKVAESARKVLGGWFKLGPGVRSDSGALWMKTWYEVLDGQNSEEKKGSQPVFRTIWPISTK